MQLVRTNNLSDRVKKLCPVPAEAPGVGCFFALKSGNDLPSGSKLVSADLQHLLKTGQVWVGEAGTDPQWKRIHSLRDLPKFKSSIHDDYESCATLTHVTPYMPQFFYVPTNMRGRRTYLKVTNRRWK